MLKKLLTAPGIMAVLLTTACGSSGTTAASTTTPATTTAATGTSSSPAATHTLAPADVRSKAAAVLHAADSTWHDEFEKGVTLTGTAKIDWWTRGGVLPVRLAAANIQAFQDADQLFTAENEPASITAWSNVFSRIPGHVQDWYNSDTGHGYDPARQAKVEADFAAAEQQAENVSAGK